MIRFLLWPILALGLSLQSDPDGRITGKSQYRSLPAVRRWWRSAAGLEPGSVVITRQCGGTPFKPQFEEVVLGKTVLRSTNLDEQLAKELMQCGKEIGRFDTVIGNTRCTLDCSGARSGAPSKETALLARQRPYPHPGTAAGTSHLLLLLQELGDQMGGFGCSSLPLQILPAAKLSEELGWAASLHTHRPFLVCLLLSLSIAREFSGASGSHA
ncbi:uncharacterized protein LOC128850845 [Cuculus canorus]|uniref:uncharacterized protein LOC128850845 n=1 Tax=Cuculus canorus TaxID=55661 RepID=UPI0023AAF74C|nr:uncharacterized protein LOC128850845 [Cuculus canorus]